MPKSGKPDFGASGGEGADAVPVARCHTASSNRRYIALAMNWTLTDSIGMVGAVLTTVCWLPQASKIIRERETRSISLPATALFTLGIFFWLIYGVALADWPLITSNVVTLALMVVIMALKLRHG
jgi:MtN3 and saliva related transmembrane protein